MLWICMDFGDLPMKNSWGAILAPSREMLGNIMLFYVPGKSYYFWREL